MNLQELDKLIQKYYEGETTEADEEKLFELLSSGHLPPEYTRDISIITGLSGSEDIPEPDMGFEARIMNAIDNSEQQGRVISLKRRIYTTVSVAASLLIIISSYLMLRPGSQPEDTFSDPVLAYNATLEILGRVSQTMNTGSDVISELSLISKAEDKLTKFSEPARLVSKELEPLKYIDKSIDILDFGSRK